MPMVSAEFLQYAICFFWLAWMFWSVVEVDNSIRSLLGQADNVNRSVLIIFVVLFSIVFGILLRMKEVFNRAYMSDWSLNQRLTSHFEFCFYVLGLVAHIDFLMGWYSK